jgi:hypothetical protein
MFNILGVKMQGPTHPICICIDPSHLHGSPPGHDTCRRHDAWRPSYCLFPQNLSFKDLHSRSVGGCSSKITSPRALKCGEISELGPEFVSLFFSIFETQQSNSKWYRDVTAKSWKAYHLFFFLRPTNLISTIEISGKCEVPTTTMLIFKDGETHKTSWAAHAGTQLIHLGWPAGCTCFRTTKS